MVSACSAGPGPVPVESGWFASGEAGTRACERFLEALPPSLADQPRRDVEPAGSRAAAYGDPAIVVVCGAPAPAELDNTSFCTSVNGVGWFIGESALAGPPEDGSPVPISLLNREAVVQLRLPPDYWPPAAALADLAPAVKQAIPGTAC